MFTSPPFPLIPESSGPASLCHRLGRPLARCCQVLIALAAGASLAQAHEPVIVPLGANFQAIIDAHPPGTLYVVSTGIHRGVTFVPKDGDVIRGEPGAVLNGCLALETWEFDGQYWVHSVPVLVPEQTAVGIDCPDALCLQTQDFYLDGVRLKPVSTREKIVGPGEWHLDRVNGKVVMLADPTGLVAELGGPSPTAINAAPTWQQPSFGVVIEDLTIEKYPCPPQVGAVRLAGGGTIRRCRVTGSHSYGIQLMVGPSLVQDCYIADNGMCGIGGTGIGSIIEGCEIANNVWPLFAGLAWDNGGVKIAGSRDVTFRRNYIHHNNGPGLWWDIRTTLMTVEDNIVEFNHWEGILMEISEQAIIRRNICRFNGVLHRRNLWGAQICVQNGSSAHISSNYLETGEDFDSPWGSRQGVMVINQVDRAWDEGIFQGDFGAHEIVVENNLLVMPSGGFSGVDYGTLGWATYEDFLAAGLVWRNNRYLVGQPLDHRWSWRYPPDWDSTVARWLLWDDWRLYQDVGSTLETIGPELYPHTGVAQFPLIQSTTGHDYEALKAQLIRRPALRDTDRDADGLPDDWERQFIPSLTAMTGAGDADGDGLSDAQERTAGTHPLVADTDLDGLLDAWEASRGLNPLVYDSQKDADGDGRSILEEQTDGTDPAVPELAELPAPEASLSFWVTPSSRLSTDGAGNLTQWRENGPLGLQLGWFGGPRVEATSATGIPLVNPGEMILVPGVENRWGDAASGFTLSFIFRPTVVNTTREWMAVLTNEIYLQMGFRLRMESGYLVLNAGQSAGSLFLAGHTRLAANQTYLITIAVHPNGKGGALYLDGKLEDSATFGVVVPSNAPLMLANTNGVTPQKGLFGDVVVFNRWLNNRERRSVEGFLQQKFFTGVPLGSDRDRDGLPDAWESTGGLDTLTPSAGGDEDRDGADNLTEYQRGLNPQVADTDGDGLPDGWEITWMTNPLVNDSLADPDQDGLSNLEEYENGTDPRVTDLDPPFLAFNRIRLWWQAGSGLESAAGLVTRWLDASTSANAGLPLNASPQVVTATTSWSGRTAVRASANPVVSSLPVDPASMLFGSGITITAAIRPPTSASAPEFRRLIAFGDVVVGAAGTSLVLRNHGGSVLGIADTPIPAGPFVLSLLVGEPTDPSRLFINGILAAEVTGLEALAPASLILGGDNAWPADIAEIVVHAGALPPLNRRFAESVLSGQWLGTGPLAGDDDADGLPDWWEYESCTDPKVADGTGDADWNGETNAAAFLAGKPGFVWRDQDGDSMHDGWEIAYGLDPQRDDSADDPDMDNLPNSLEHALLGKPDTFDATNSWSVAFGDSAASAPLVLRLRLSQRSWARHARWESSPSLLPGSWQWLPPGTIIKTGPGPVAEEELILPPESAGGLSRLLVRVGLSAE